MMNDYPVIRGHFVYSEPVQALTWLKGCVRNIAVHIVYAEYWLSERMYHSRYSLVPIGNLDGSSAPGPQPALLFDTIYARALTMAKHILWYSDDRGHPDLGGHED